MASSAPPHFVSAEHVNLVLDRLGPKKTAVPAAPQIEEKKKTSFEGLVLGIVEPAAASEEELATFLAFLGLDSKGDKQTLVERVSKHMTARTPKSMTADIEKYIAREPDVASQTKARSQILRLLLQDIERNRTTAQTAKRHAQDGILRFSQQQDDTPEAAQARQKCHQEILKVLDEETASKPAWKEPRKSRWNKLVESLS